MHGSSLVPAPPAVAVRCEAVAHGTHEPWPRETRWHPRLAVPHLRPVARARRRPSHGTRRRHSRRIAHLGRLLLPGTRRGSGEDHAPTSVTLTSDTRNFSLLGFDDLTLT